MHLDATAAAIPAEKLRDYLLSPVHPIGRYKSAFFRSLGYSQDQWQVLERDLRLHLSNEARSVGITEYGQKFSVSGPLSGPNGRSADLVSMWIILANEKIPRFITAYPGL